MKVYIILSQQMLLQFTCLKKKNVRVGEGIMAPPSYGYKNISIAQRGDGSSIATTTAELVDEPSDPPHLIRRL